MSEQCGKLVTCDRCGKTLFLKCIGEGEADGVIQDGINLRTHLTDGNIIAT